MVENLTRLWVLQTLDNEIDDLTEQYQKIPHEIETLKQKLLNLKKDVETTKQHLLDLKKRYKLTEVDLKGCEDKISQFSVQLYGAKTNEQYKAFLNEIEAQKRSKTEIEEKMIALIEETETTEDAIKLREQELAQDECRARAEIEQRQAIQTKLDKEINDRTRERQTIVAELSKEILKTYERIKNGKGRLAVVRITDERCGGCLTPLPPQLVLEVNKQDRLIFCEYCGRILIAPVE
jgi:predicted  nucleic acid-binding Zn-ribbon protein